MHSVLIILSECTYFYISKKLLHTLFLLGFKIVESLKCILKSWFNITCFNIIAGRRGGSRSSAKPGRSLDFTGPERCSGKKNVYLKSGQNTSEGEKVVPSQIFFKDFASIISNLLLFLQILRTTMFGSSSEWLLPCIKEKRILSVSHLEILAVG